ncbi:MAG: hypothetical protein D6803_04585 [Anaerolineae bacterium]|nr:MAG: hypothetical protein D6803_04585 [Anaerolineae bacterium]
MSAAVAENLRVECRAEYTYPQRPVAVWLDERRIEVAEVLREWRSPEGRAFEVLLDDGRQLRLVYREDVHSWSVQG